MSIGEKSLFELLSGPLQVLRYTLIKIVMGMAALLSTFSLSAQVDPSSASLLRPRNQNVRETPTFDRNSLDSSRYNIRTDPRPSERSQRESFRSEPLPKSPEKNPPKSADNLESKMEGDSNNGSNRGQDIDPSKTSETPSESKDNNEVSDQVRDLILGGSDETIKEYKSLLHPFDIRQNIVEVSASTGVFYQNSGSNYWYRRYYSYGPLATAGAALWLTPFLGFNGEFTTSLASDIVGNVDGSLRIPADYQWWSGGIRFRKSFALDRRSSHLIIGVDFNESRLNVPANAPDRIRVRTSGAAISLGLQKPTSPNHSWEVGVKLLPRQDQNEGKTGIAISSGAKQQTYSIGFWLGSRFLLDRKNQYFWQLSHYFDKSLYDGQANKVDPSTGLQPSGVQVSNGTSMFRMGYTWGE